MKGTNRSARRPPEWSDLEDEPFLSVADLAARYQVSEPTVHQWLYKGTAPRSLKIGRYRRFRRSDVLFWEDAKADPEPAA